MNEENQPQGVGDAAGGASMPAPRFNPESVAADTPRDPRQSVLPPMPLQRAEPERAPHPAVTWTEIAGVVALIAVADLTIYRGRGFAGYAALFALAPWLLLIASTRRFTGTAFWITTAMLLAAAVKLVWGGWWAAVAAGFGGLVACAMAIAGFIPYVPEAITFAAQTLQAGLLAIIHYARRLNTIQLDSPKTSWVTIGLPMMAFIAFSVIFILANPDLAVTFGQNFERVFERLQQWLQNYSPDFLEVLFCIGVLWIVAGLLRPIFTGLAFTEPSGNGHARTAVAAPSAMYAAFRNTLITVIALFAMYLVFEFKTLWFRTFPTGFYYSGYAHEGAAWLTAALALSTLILSLVFRGDVLQDPRILKLRRLAWIWSIENIVLAIAVYHRLFIYIGFNGMTRMRIVGLYGISAVVIGFLLVVWKIAKNHGFLWLVRRQLWTLAIGLYLLALTPRDAIVVPYNVRRILAGDLAPAVQISVHPIDSEGLPFLKPLLNSENEFIREGIAALLADRDSELERKVAIQQRDGWTAYQISDRVALESLRKNREQWNRYLSDQGSRRMAFQRFQQYVYQWY